MTRPALVSSPTTAVRSRTSTFGSASTRSRTTCSTRTRLAAYPALHHDGMRMVVSPRTTNRQRSPIDGSPPPGVIAPPAARSALNPGNNPASTRRPAASSPCAWCDCGTNRRCSGPSGSASRSTTRTSPQCSESTLAASSPAIPAPSTTTRSYDTSHI
ncbi:hypothetical protein ACFQV2_25735 [Actinokineospora soli]|uniref:Uncharacterized protein n=1 Tax=Actinokineospora soli TaxID=1048753 RepID=A0ABW2TRA5_9PSEU